MATTTTTVCVRGALFEGLPATLSLPRGALGAARRDGLPEALAVTAQTDSGDVVAISHRALPVHALGFRPDALDDAAACARLCANLVRLAERTSAARRVGLATFRRVK